MVLNLLYDWQTSLIGIPGMSTSSLDIVCLSGAAVALNTLDSVMQPQIVVKTCLWQLPCLMLLYNQSCITA